MKKTQRNEHQISSEGKAHPFFCSGRKSIYIKKTRVKHAFKLHEFNARGRTEGTRDIVMVETQCLKNDLFSQIESYPIG